MMGEVAITDRKERATDRKTREGLIMVWVELITVGCGIAGGAGGGFWMKELTNGTIEQR